jgi:enolase
MDNLIKGNLMSKIRNITALEIIKSRDKTTAEIEATLEDGSFSRPAVKTKIAT